MHHEDRGKSILGAAAMAILAAGCATEMEVVTAADIHPLTGAQPNIVVIMVDDLDLDGMETMLELGLAPNIERYMVREGAVFTESFVANALCCPSRATFLTGQYSHNNGVLTNHGDTGGVKAFDDSSTLGTWLQGGGYRTSYAGKYLNGYGIRPRSAFRAERPRYVPPGWDHWQGMIGARNFNYRVNDSVDGVTQIVRYGEEPMQYKTTVLADRSAAFIRDAEVRNDEQPFFLVVMPKTPHPEPNHNSTSRFDHHVSPDPMDLVEKPEKMELIAGLTPTSFGKPSFDYVDPTQPSWLREIGAGSLTETHIGQITSYYRQRLAAMLSVDDLVGTVMTALEETGEIDNTVVFFTSDNGYTLGEHRWHMKLVAFEESIRVPLYARGPGIAPGQEIHQPVVNADLAPTIAELAGVTPGLPVDGRSLLPLLTAGEAPAWRDQIFVEHFDNLTVPDYRALRTSRYLYVEYEDGSGERELYDLSFDPYQTVSLHADAEQVDTVAALGAQLEQLRTCGGGSCQAFEVAGEPW
jgi:N-acetylglucosamine-6-sulfatase